MGVQIAILVVAWTTLLVLAALIAVLVHEFGHVLGAWLGQIPVAWMRIGPLVLYGTGQIQVPRRSWAIASVGFNPVALSPNGFGLRHMLSVGGGPAASLVVALGSIMLVGVVPAGFAAGLWAVASWSGLIGISDLLPLTYRGRWTDGRWLWTWLARPQRARVRVAVGSMWLAAELGFRPRDWPQPWVSVAATAEPERDSFEPLRNAYLSLVDRSETERAGAILSMACERLGDSPAKESRGLVAEAAFFSARYRSDPSRAERLMATIESNEDFRIVWAAIHLAAGRMQEALNECDRAEANLKDLRSFTESPWWAAVMAMDALTAIRTEAQRVLEMQSSVPSEPD